MSYIMKFKYISITMSIVYVQHVRIFNHTVVCYQSQKG